MSGDQKGEQPGIHNTHTQNRKDFFHANTSEEFLLSPYNPKSRTKGAQQRSEILLPTSIDTTVGNAVDAIDGKRL